MHIFLCNSTCLQRPMTRICRPQNKVLMSSEIKSWSWSHIFQPPLCRPYDTVLNLIPTNSFLLTVWNFIQWCFTAITSGMASCNLSLFKISIIFFLCVFLQCSSLQQAKDSLTHNFSDRKNEDIVLPHFTEERLTMRYGTY